MKKVPLSELVAEEGQASVAKSLGVSPAAISKALSAKREILVICMADGSRAAQELRPFPSQAPKTMAMEGCK